MFMLSISRYGAILAGSAMLLTIMSGCSNQGAGAAKTEAQATPAENKPVTIRVGVKAQGYLTDEEFARYFSEPVKKKYPWITVEKVIYASKGAQLADLVAAGTVPDIVVTNNVNGMPEFLDLNLTTPLNELIQKQKLDLNRFEPQALDAVKAAAQSKDLVALPYSRNFQALYYNKDIFDKFGVNYPKDGMTWEQATALAKQLTRNENGTKYRGFEPNVPERLASQLSTSFIDPASNKAALDSPQWKQVMDQLIKIYSIPGNEQVLSNKGASELIYKSKTLAMLAEINILSELAPIQDLNWDMAAYPVWPERPGTSPSIDAHLMVLSNTSQAKEDAFRVMSAVLSDEVQTDMSKQGRYSILKDAKIKEAFGKELTWMAGKNMKAVNLTPANPYAQTIYDKEGINAARNAVKAVIEKGKDANTALREANEAFDKKIEEMKKK
jgi:multiple sugar transport system substrate-binding protein